jgi:hypothetical protein
MPKESSMTTAYDAGRSTTDEGRELRGVRDGHAVGGDRLRDRVHWGPVWAGVLVALPVFLVLQLLFFAFGVLDLGNNGSGQTTTASIVSAVLGLVAFFVGGFMAGSTAASRDSDEGVLHGVLTWAVGIVAIIGFGLFGAGSLLGDIATSASQLQGLGPQAAQAGQAAGQIDPAVALQAAHQGAGWAALALGLTVIAAAAGGTAGQKAGPRR